MKYICRFSHKKYWQKRYYNYLPNLITCIFFSYESVLQQKVRNYLLKKGEGGVIVYVTTIQVLNNNHNNS